PDANIVAIGEFALPLGRLGDGTLCVGLPGDGASMGAPAVEAFCGAVWPQPEADTTGEAVTFAD
ncbi:MAG: hypothetical protein ACRD4B_02180, partial [Acidobacteriota bacterium]